MRAHTVLFVLVLVLVAGLALSNLDTLTRPTSLNLYFLGAYVVQARLLGLVAVLLTAGLFALLSSLSETRAKARSADDLRRIDELRSALERGETARLGELRSALEARLLALGARQEASAADLAASVNARVDRVRDELAADIAHTEDALLRAAAGDTRLIEADRPSLRKRP